MYDAIDRLLESRDGVTSRQALLSIVSRNQLDAEIRRGHLVSVFPRAYCRPWNAEQDAVRQRAAVVSAGPHSALSHDTALRRWGQRLPQAELIHVTTACPRQPRGVHASLRVHRTRLAVQTHMVRGVPTVAPEWAVVQAWQLPGDRRARTIEALRTGLTVAAAIRRVSEAAIRFGGRAELLQLVGLIEDGCESELEIWGHLQVFDIPGLRHGIRQRPIWAGGRSYRLDYAFEAEKVALELDGAAYHCSREQRERDQRRDLALAGLGWQTVRLSHHRLTTDAEGCRREVLAVLAARRRWTRSG